MERWRYGDFCSQNHKDDFTQETQRLVQERLMSLRRPEPSSLSTNTLFVDSPTVPGAPEEDPAFAELEAPPEVQAATPPESKTTSAAPPAPEPDPGIQEFVTQSVIAPLPPRRPAPATEAPPQKPNRKDWKYLAKVADFDVLPVGINTGLSRLFRTMEVASGWAGEEFVVPATRLVFVPEPFQPEERRARVQLPSAELRPREAYQHESWASAPPPVAIPRRTWVDDSGRRWVYSEVIAGPGDYPGIGEVLEDYPISAPWTDWPEWMLKGEPAWAPPSSARRSPSPPAPLSPPRAGGSMPGDGVPPPAAAQGFPLAPVAPAAPVARAAGRGTSSPSAARPAEAGPPAQEHGAVGFGARPHGASERGAPGTPPTASGVTGVGGHPASGGDYAPPAARGASPSGARPAAVRGAGGKGANARWQPIVPPIFHALIDVAHGMQAIPAQYEVRALPCLPLRIAAPARLHRPSVRFSVAARLHLTQPAQILVVPPGPLDVAAATVWAVSEDPSWPEPALALPRLRFRVRKPGLPALPRHVSLRLPLLDRWNVQPSEPAMFLGASHRW